MRIVRPLSVACVLACLVACAPEENLEDRARQSGLCEGKCDGLRADGALIVSKTWVPDDGFVRVTFASGETLTVVPMDGVTITPGTRHHTVRFSQEGFFEVQSRAGEQISARVKVRVSNDGPQLALAGAGSFYTLGDGPVAVRGTATDPLGAPLRLSLGGQAIPVEGGAFEAAVPGQFGINVLSLTAVDAAENRFVYTRSFLAARSFGTGPQPLSARLDDRGLAVLIDGLKPVLPRLVRIPIITDPVKTYLGNDIYLDGVELPGQNGRPGQMDLGLELRAGKIHAVFDAGGDVYADGRIDWLLAGWSDYDAVLTGVRVDLDLRFVPVGGSLDVVAENVVVTLDGVELHVEHIPDWLVSVFSGLIKGILADTVAEQIPEMIRVLLVALEGNVPVEVPIPGNPVAIELSYGVTSIVPSAGSLRLTVGAQAHGEPLPPGTQGAPLRDESAAEAPTDAPFGVAIGYNLFNQVSFTLWKANAFEISLTEADLAEVLAQVPEIELLHPTLDVTARLGLPAVADGTADGLRVSIGELQTEILVSTDLFEVTLHATVAARADVDVSVTEQKLHADLTVKEIHVDLERHAFPGLDPEAAERFVEALAPVLVDVVEARLGDLPLPFFDLAAAGLPEVKVGLKTAVVTATEQAIGVAAELSILAQ
jgi:hypothetical protein